MHSAVSLIFPDYLQPAHGRPRPPPEFIHKASPGGHPLMRRALDAATGRHAGQTAPQTPTRLAGRIDTFVYLSVYVPAAMVDVRRGSKAFSKRMFR